VGGRQTRKRTDRDGGGPGGPAEKNSKRHAVVGDGAVAKGQKKKNGSDGREGGVQPLGIGGRAGNS